MGLRFEPPTDPLTVTSPSVSSHVIDSDALQRLTKEIERYGKRELAGRSVLIAGHRGVGKTTLVRKAIENARSFSSLYHGRPIFVDLHGPDLLSPPEKAPSANPEKVATPPGSSEHKTAEASTETGKNSRANADPASIRPAPAAGTTSSPGAAPDTKPSAAADLQSFVERLTFSLYRAAVKEFVNSFRSLRFRDAVQSWEYSELAEQFALELDGTSDLGKLRLLYERANAFPSGVLNTLSEATGAQELALLATSSQAYRIISGKLDEDRTQESSGSNTVNWSVAADNLLSPVTGLLTGSLVWTSLPGDFGPLAKLLTAFTSALASAIAVKFTRTVQRQSKQSTKITFVPENNRLALRRLLPVLVDRFCELGIPPIFVVDELDKVPDISERMQNLMGFLKQFVTERAFFCFLADRDYYEGLEAKVSSSAFPLESTLFGDRLFVQYAPEAAHDFLKNVIKLGDLATGESKDDAERDAEVLRYVLLRRSFMHPFDLRREISRCTNAKNEFRFAPRALFNVQQYRNEVYYQVAVECVLAGERLLDFAEDPNRAQLLYDALYFPIRAKKLPEEFDSSRNKLEEHIGGRMGKDNGKLLSNEDCDTLYDALLQLLDFLCEPRSLLEAMQSLSIAKYLQAPRSFPPAVVGVIEAAAGPRVSEPETATDALMETQAAAAAGSVAAVQPVAPVVTAPPVPSAQAPVTQAANSVAQSAAQLVYGSVTKATPLLVRSTVPSKYRWQFDKFGYPFVPGISIMRRVELVKKGVPESGATPMVAPPVTALISDFEEAARLLTSNQGTSLDIELWERIRLIPTPPAWSFVREAAEALRNPASVPPTRLEEYSKALTDYRSYLESSLFPIWYAVALAETMTLHASKAEFVKQSRKSLEAIAEVLAESTSRDPALEQLHAITSELISAYPPPSIKHGAGYRETIEALAASANSLRKFGAQFNTAASVQAAAVYQEWFTNFYMGKRPQLRSFWPFLGLVTDSLPFGLRKINPLRMTIADWTQASSEQQNAGQRMVILERLGFRSDVDHLLVALPPKDRSELSDAMAKSIQIRGYEKGVIVLRCLRTSLADQWFPSENVACHMSRTESDPKPDADYRAKYVALEIDQSVELEQIRNQVSRFGLGNATKVALFGPAGLTPPSPNVLRGLPCIVGPQSLDDLVSRLDARSPTDWDTPKTVAG